MEATSAAGAAAMFATTATDIVDGDTAVVFTEGGVNIDSGAIFGLGEHIITASTIDQAGNTSSEQFTITVRDTTAPALSMSTDIETNAGLGMTITNGGLTRDNTLTLSGAVVDAVGVASVRVFDGASLLGEATITNGVWSFTTQTLIDGHHELSAKAFDGAGNNSVTASMTVEIDASGPIITSGVPATVAENTGAGQIVYSAAATDANAFSYSLKANNLDDANAFTIDATSGEVTLLANPDFENKSSYSFTVVATDVAGNATEKVLSLGITDVNEAPNTSPVTISTVENAELVVPLIPDYATDPDAGDMLTLTSWSAVTLAWAADSTSTSLINPVTKAAVNLSQLATLITKTADGSGITIAPSAELDWLVTGQAITATFDYTVNDRAGLTTSNHITLTIVGSTADKGKNLNGGSGNDTLSGDSTVNAEDVLQGGNGADILSGFGSTDVLYGGTGDDKLFGGSGIDYLYGDNGSDTLDGGTDGDFMYGGTGDDKLLGDAGIDYLYGENGNDLLEGGAQGDFIFGGNGNDKLLGGSGDDILAGGSGADKFVFETRFGNDRITDFKLSEGDKLYFTDLISAGMTAEQFISNYVTDIGDDLLISLPGGSIVLVGVADVNGLANAISFGWPV